MNPNDAQSGLSTRDSRRWFAATGFTVLLTGAGALCMQEPHLKLLIPAFVLALFFSGAAWLARAATSGAAACGFLIAFISWLELEEAGLGALLVLVVITTLCTRIGRERKRKAGTEENPRGRSESQILANLGIFGMLGAAFPWTAHAPWMDANSSKVAIMIMTGAVAALAEAAGDTVSSELGQVFGGVPYLLTTFRRVPAGTDGGISIMGTFSGACAAALIVAVWALLGGRCRPCVPAMFVGAIAGIFFDSLLGATVERPGWLRNDDVNFLSTAFAAVTSMLIVYVQIVTGRIT